MKKMNYSLEDWQDIFIKCRVISKLELGLGFKALAVDLKENGYPCTPDAIRKAIKRLGYIKSETQGLYYKENQKEMIRFMDMVDIEEMTDLISHERYYSCYLKPFWERKKRNTVNIEIDKEIFEEYKELSKEFGCDFEEEYLIYTLLKQLDEVKPVDKTREFALRRMKEVPWYSKEEIEFMLSKEKEGYIINQLKSLAEDYDLLELTEDEFREIAEDCKCTITNEVYSKLRKASEWIR